MKTQEAKLWAKTSKVERQKIDCIYIDRARGRRPEAKSNARTQKSSNSLICFRCSNFCFLLELALLVVKLAAFTRQMRPKPEK